MISSKLSTLQRTIPMTLILAAALCLTAATAFAGNVYSTGFENPPFVIGPLAAQGGWQVFGSAIVTVESFQVQSGSQAVFVDGSGTGQSGPWLNSPTGAPVVILSAGFYLASSSTETGWQLAALGLNLAPFIGGIDVDANTNAIHAITAGNPVVGTLTRDTWHNAVFVMDFGTQTYSVSLDGTSLAANVPFCGDNGPCLGAAVGSFGSGIFDTFAAAGTGNDSGFLDNYSVSTPVPEPGSIALLGSGILGLAGVIRRKIMG